LQKYEHRTTVNGVIINLGHPVVFTTRGVSLYGNSPLVISTVAYSFQ